MVENQYTSLDTAGYISDPNAKAERIFATYLATNFSQSNTFKGKLKSYFATLQRGGNQIEVVCRGVEQDLTELYGKYFTTVQVNVTASGKPKADGSLSTTVFNLNIEATLTSSSGTITLARALTLSNDRLKNVATMDFNV